jgi:hypothetical protein
VSHGKHPTLDTFTQENGHPVNYKAVINDNQAFYAKLKPSLESGEVDRMGHRGHHERGRSCRS